MKLIIQYAISIIILLSGNFINSQTIYFNKIYSFDFPEVWGAGKDVIDVGDGYIITGATGDTLNFYWNRIGILKVDYSGNKIWEKDYGDTIARYYTSDTKATHKIGNDYYVSGSKQYYNPNTFSVGYLMRFNAEWDTLWTKEYNWDLVPPRDTSISFRQMYVCDNMDMVFVGNFVDSGLEGKVLLLKADSLGCVKWIKTYGYGGSVLFSGYSVIQTSDNGFAIGGYKYIPGQAESGDPIVVKTDSVGNQQWIKSIGGPIKDYKAMLSLDHDNNIIAGTIYGDQMSGSAIFGRINIVKLDNEGNVIWDKKYGESRLYNYLMNTITFQEDNIIAVGTSPDVFPHTIGWLLKVKSNGDSIWYREYQYFSGEQSMHNLYTIIQTLDTGYLACGYSTPLLPDTGIQSAWLIKLDSNGCDTPGCDPTVIIPVERLGNTDEILIYPNPAHWQFTVVSALFLEKDCVFRIFDLYGRKAKEIQIPRGTEEVNIDVSGWQKGLYLVRVESGEGFSESKKVIVN